MIKNHDFQQTPVSCSCSCNTRSSAPHRMTTCVKRWATVLVSAIVLMTFLTVAFVMFAVLNAQGKPSTNSGKIYSKPLLIEALLIRQPAVMWREYCRFGVKHYPIRACYVGILLPPRCKRN